MAGILGLIPIVNDLIGKFVADPGEKMKLQLELAKLADAENQREHEQLVAQTEVNKVEASHRSIFVAGWRPFVGWGCGVALIYNTLIAPLFGTGVADLGFLQTILLGMLGLGGLRTYEKVRGVAESTIGKANEPVSLPLPVPVKKKKSKIWPF